MAARHLPLFALVAVLWGIPYLLIAVALTGFDAPFVAWGRVALAAVVLVAVVGPRSLVRSLRGRLPAVCGFAVVQFTVPLVLIAEAERAVVRPIAALVGLAVVCTAVAFPLWFALIARVGAARAALVTYASPVVAVALGVVLLGEQPGRLAPVGLALILTGSWLASRAGSAAHVQATPPGGSGTGQAQLAALT